MTPEGKVKEYLREQCKKRGWECLPLENRQMEYWPDRTIIVPLRRFGSYAPGLTLYAEVKTGNPKKDDRYWGQKGVIGNLEVSGFFARMVEGKVGVDRFMVEAQEYVDDVVNGYEQYR